MSEEDQRVAVVTGGTQGIVDGILFLEASPYITGEIVHIDGGEIAGH